MGNGGKTTKKGHNAQKRCLCHGKIGKSSLKFVYVAGKTSNVSTTALDIARKSVDKKIILEME